MSVSAYSCLLLGVEVTVMATPTQKAVTRYDPVTGVPGSVELTVLELSMAAGGPFLAVSAGDANYQAAQDKDKYLRLDAWVREQTSFQLASWFAARGFKSQAGDITRRGDLVYMRNRGQYFVGRLLLDTDSSGYGDDKATGTIEVPSAEEVDKVHAALIDCFGPKAKRPRLVLSTTLS
jgi:hypothetical protein